ncbi:phage minor head protein [Paenibacillus illinoisensis]|uniref:phage minor head protein n=1 Tax=Paenibacillus illinoisensis TaxID=59845 RepID=UPI003016A6BF
MEEEIKKANSNIVSTADLGEGRKEVTFSLDSSNMVNELEKSGIKLGTGSVMNRFDPSTRRLDSYGFTSNDTPYTQVYNGLPIDPHKKIQLAIDMYYKEPIIGAVIDMMVDFSSSGFTNECDDAEVKKVFDKWSEELNVNELLEKVFLEYYRSGNVTIYRSKNNAKVKKRKTTKAATNVEIDIQEYNFPSGYTILNPMNVYVNGSMVFGKELIQLKLSKELQNMINSPESPNNYLVDIPTELIRDARSGENFATLNPDYTSRITRKKMDYERYASPFLERIFEPVMFKSKLRLMDMSTIEGLVNQLVTVTVGDKDYPATDEDLKAIAELFQTPNKAYTVFWNHTLKVQFHKPEGLDTLTADKYKQVNEDILSGLGVSRILLDGGNGSQSNTSSSWISMLSFIERLDNARAKVKHWLESEYKRIADENGFKTYPRVRFNKMNLREDTYIRDVLLAMYDRGLIDEEDILTEVGRDFHSVVDMKKRNERTKDLFLPPEQPFQGGNSGPNDSGRPAGPGKKIEDRETSPEKNKGEPSKTSKATASYAKAEEDYASELISQYSSIQEEIIALLHEHEEEDERVKKVIVASAIIALFKTFGIIGTKHIEDIFNDEISHFSDREIAKSVVMKRDLKDWNDSYVSKLSHDINEEIAQALSSGKSITDTVNDVFQSNKFRVSLMSQAGIIESVRQAQIIGNQAIGKINATWIAHIDDRTCATCKGLHGRAFAIEDVPPRPHSGCRCTLEFN